MQRQGLLLFCALATGFLAASFALTQSTQSPTVQQAAQPIPSPTSAGVQQTAPPAPGPYFDDAVILNKSALELKQEVDKSTKDELSLSVIRRAAAIEKLAHSLKLRMHPDGGLQ